MRHRYAFLPLISDPDGRDKSRLFHDLETETEVELAADAPHPPVFACVMRKQGSHSAHKQLECHGFVCNTSEDAIIIAANLYQVRKNLLSRYFHMEFTQSVMSERTFMTFWEISSLCPILHCNIY